MRFKLYIILIFFNYFDFFFRQAIEMIDEMVISLH